MPGNAARVRAFACLMQLSSRWGLPFYVNDLEGDCGHFNGLCKILRRGAATGGPHVWRTRTRMSRRLSLRLLLAARSLRDQAFLAQTLEFVALFGDVFSNLAAQGLEPRGLAQRIVGRLRVKVAPPFAGRPPAGV